MVIRCAPLPCHGVRGATNTTALPGTVVALVRGLDHHLVVFVQETWLGGGNHIIFKLFQRGSCGCGQAAAGGGC